MLFSQLTLLIFNTSFWTKILYFWRSFHLLLVGILLMLSLCQYFFDIMLLQLKYVMTFFSHGYTKNISSDKGVSWEKCNIQRFSQLNFNLTCHFYTDDTISNYKDFLQQSNQRQPNQNISTSYQNKQVSNIYWHNICQL